jgi:outer membrane protein assembly factor BamB
MRSHLITFAVALMALAGLSGTAQEKGKKAPKFTGSWSRNSADPQEKNVPDDFSVGKDKAKKVRHVKWTAALGSLAYSGPVYAAGRIFMGTNNARPRDPKIKGEHGVLMCFDATTGSLLWQHTHPRAEQDNDSGHLAGLISAPWVEGDRLWYVSNRAEMICSDLNGKVQWKYDMVKELDVFVGQHVYTAPLVVGDLVYALTCNGVDANTQKLPKPKAPSLVALNKKTGKLAWSNNLPGANVIRGQWSSPTAATVNGKDQVIYGGGDGWLYGLDAKSGELVWKFDCNPKKATPYKVGGGGERSFIIATPVVHDGKCYVGVGQEPDDGPGVGHLWCIDITKKPGNKEKDLSPVGDNFDPKAAVNKDSGLVWHYGGKLPKPTPDGREWVFGRTMGTVAVHDGLVYAAEVSGFLHCVDAKTGKEVWVHDFQEDTWCSPYYADGKVFVGTNAGELLIYKAGRKLTAPKKITIGQPVKVPPVAVDGVLYVNGGTNLYAISAK